MYSSFTGPWGAGLLRPCLVALAVALPVGTSIANEADDEDQALSQLGELVTRQVHSASRYTQTSLDAPAVVWVIPREQILGHGHTTLAQALEAVPSAYFSSDRTYTSFGMRGFNRPGDYNTRTLMLIDGQRVNDPIFDQGMPGDEFPMVADWIKRVEFVPGPASSVYGGNALLGTAQVVTVDGSDEPGLRTKLSVGSFGLRRAAVSLGRTLEDGADLFLGLVTMRQDGETLFLPEHAGADNPGGRAAGLDGTRRNGVLLKYRTGAWRLSLIAHERVKDMPNAPYETVFGQPGTYVTDRHAMASLAWDGGVRGPWHPQARVTLGRYGFYGRYVYEGDPGTLINRDAVTANWLDADVRATWRGWVNHTLVLGAETRQTLDAHQRNFDVDPPSVHVDDERRTHSYALFVQDEYRLSERWLLTGGLRGDVVQGMKTEWSPRAAVVFRPSQERALKLMLGRAFRAPNLGERYYADGVSQRQNPGLRAEHLRTVELALEQAMGERTQLTVTAYRYELRDLIEMDAGDAGALPQYRNLGKARVDGLALYWEHATSRGLRLRSSVAVQDARSQGRWLSNSPRWLLKGGALAPLGPEWQGGLEAVATGARLDREGQRVPARTLAHLTVQYSPVPEHSLMLRVRNIGDVRHDDPSPPWIEGSRVRQPRRSIELSWSARF